MMMTSRLRPVRRLA